MARIGFALAGVRSAWRQEASLRTEGWVFLGALGLWAWRQPPLFWWMVLLFAAALVFLAELLNTALENVCDALHPESHPMIGAAKDCASGAVLVANSLAIGLPVLFLWQTW